MDIATEEETERFIGGLWYSWGQRLVKDICRAYKLGDEQEEALINVLLRPNDWKVVVKQSLR